MSTSQLKEANARTCSTWTASPSRDSTVLFHRRSLLTLWFSARMMCRREHQGKSRPGRRVVHLGSHVTRILITHFNLQLFAMSMAAAAKKFRLIKNLTLVAICKFLLFSPHFYVSMIVKYNIMNGAAAVYYLGLYYWLVSRFCTISMPQLLHQLMSYMTHRPELEMGACYME